MNTHNFLVRSFVRSFALLCLPLSPSVSCLFPFLADPCPPNLFCRHLTSSAKVLFGRNGIAKALAHCTLYTVQCLDKWKCVDTLELCVFNSSWATLPYLFPFLFLYLFSFWNIEPMIYARIIIAEKPTHKCHITFAMVVRIKNSGILHTFYILHILTAWHKGIEWIVPVRPPLSTSISYFFSFPSS